MATDGTPNDTVTVSLEGPKTAKQVPPPTKPKKIYIPIRIRTNALNNDDIAINAAYISIEDLTRVEGKRNYEVRYLDSIRSLKDKIKSSYSCNQDQCPAIQQRLQQHQQQHHADRQRDRESQTISISVSPIGVTLPMSQDSHGLMSTEPAVKKCAAVCPSASILKRNPRQTRNQRIQTPSVQFNKFVDSTNIVQGSFESNPFLSDEGTQSVKKPIGIENETAITPKTSYARQDLNEEILKWFEDIPIYPNLTPSIKNLRRNMVNEFIDKIFELTNDSNLDDYDTKVSYEIDNFLNALPMWYPGAKRDQHLLKKGIKNNLLKTIKNKRDDANNEFKVAALAHGTVNTNDDVIDSRSIIQSEAKEKLIEGAVLQWLMQLKFKESGDIGKTVNMLDATVFFTKRLMPLLDKPTGTKNYKLVLKGLILDTLMDLPNVHHFPKNKRVYLNRMVETLANRLLLIQSKFKNSFSKHKFPRDRSMYRLTVCSKSSLKQSLFEGLKDCFTDYGVDKQNEIKEDIADIVIDCLESTRNQENDDCDEMDNALKNSIESSGTQARDSTVKNVRDILTEDIIHNADCNRNHEMSCHSGIISVFTSEQEIGGPSKYPLTSTPKNKTGKKEISKLNVEEERYISQVSSLIRAWMELLPVKFDGPEDTGYKNTMIQDLAGEIMDQVKLEQLTPEADYDRHKFMKFFICKWLLKFDIYEDIHDGAELVENLIQKLKEIPVPTLTKPQHGSRQAMSNIKYMESDLAWKEPFVPKGVDILEDEISIFMSELPSEVYATADKDRQNMMAHELADTVKNCLEKKRPESEISEQLSKWLKQMVKPKQNIQKLTEELKDRIMKLPQDATLAANRDKKAQRRKEALEDKANARCCNVCVEDKDSNNAATVAPDIDRTLMEFIGKFMERNYDVDDSLARGAFGDLLKIEFRKLSPPTRKEVYDNFSKSKGHDEFSPERLGKELEYIKVISDWLKNIPLDGSYNTPNNKTRIEFVNDLAKNVYDVEESRRQSPFAMDYDMYLASIISQNIQELPILPEYADNDHVILMICQLVGMIAGTRTPMPCCKNKNQTASSVNTTGIEEQDISDFIDNYIRLNSGDIADDQVKLDAWSARLLKEAKKLIRDTADPSTLCKTQVYNKLMNVPIPGEESVRIFGLELDYAKEISDWLNNLPLLPITSQEANHQQVKMISKLAEKFADREKYKVVNPTETPPDSEIEEFIATWIRQLPLDQNREVVFPIVIQQLLRRIDRINNGPEESVPLQTSVTDPNTSRKNKSKTKSKSPSCKPSCCKPGGKAGQSGQVMIEAIDNWAHKLPVHAENKDAEETIKNDVARKLYQKAGELSVDPQIMNDDLLYEELFTDEVNAQLNNLKSPEIQKNKDKLKNELVDKVMEAKSIVKESTAGDNYKHQLENTIEASIPNPINNRQHDDPGFEIYKNRLAEMFILENFDHGNDAVKSKYENIIKKEIDKFFQEALKRNALPLSKEQIYSELYSALYKVSVPNESSTTEEVEEVKTRCEIDDWYANLPLREASGVDEMLEQNKILSMLAKRLHEIERNEQKPDEKMHKEITKWIKKFPLISGSDIDKLADDLQNRLKSSKEDRKCVPATPISSKKGKVQQKTTKSKGILGTSQIAGPSSAGQMWASPPPAAQVCCQESPTPRKKAADIILEIVQNWCASLPMYASTADHQEAVKILKEDLVTKIIIKICELNSNPQTFSDDILYNYLLDQELNKLLSQVPICCDLEPTKDNKKMELVRAIDSVKELMREERSRHEYVKELKDTVNTILEEPLDTTADKIALFNEIREEIVENFIQGHYNRDDDEMKQMYKAKLRDAVNKYFIDVNEKSEDPPVDPLIIQNQLMCELAKISIPSERDLKDEVEEIRMKDEVKQFFDELAFEDEDEEKMALRNSMKNTLAKQLNEIEKTGHNCSNDAKMMKEISRCLSKLEKEVDPEKIQTFIDSLKANEGVRKAPPPGKEDTCYCTKGPDQIHTQTGPCQCSGSHNQPTATAQFVGPPVSQNLRLSQLHIPEFRGRQSSSMHPQESKSLGVAPVEYQGFGGGVVFSSSRQVPNQMNRSLPVGSAQSPSPKLNQTAPNLEVPLIEGQFMRPSQDSSQEAARAEENGQRKRRKIGSDEDDCKCMSRKRGKMRGPRCVLRRPADYCDECDDFGIAPMWIPMPPFPPYHRFPPGYFYY